MNDEVTQPEPRSGASPTVERGMAPDGGRRSEGGWIDGRFRLLFKLGEGGFGLVWKAEQMQPIQRTVALKILKAGMDTRQVIARFEAERQVLALMEHPNISRVLDAGQTENGRPYFVMELVRGEPLTRYSVRHQLPVKRRLELFLDVCAAVHHAHQKGIIHRDLKPSNVMVSEEENGGVTVKVIDFGIAKAMQGGPLGDHTVFTGIDQLVGTPGYISPEQISHGGDAVDTRSDVYALGSILFELLTGKPLIAPAELVQKPLHQLLRDILERDAPAPSTRDPSLKGDLDWITLKALEADPVRRYASADALAEDIRCYLTDLPIQARPPSSGYLLRKFACRHRVGVTAFAMVMLALLTGGVVSTLLYFRAESARQEADRRGEEMRFAYSEADAVMARQFEERDRYPDAVLYYCRSLRTDPRNERAAVSLLSLIRQVHLTHPVCEQLLLPDGAREARLTAVSRRAARVLAVSSVPQTGAEDRDVVSIWEIDRQIRTDYPLQKGVLVTSLTVDPKGRWAFFGQDNGRVLAWDLTQPLDPRVPTQAGGMRELNPIMAGSVLSLDCSLDGQWVAAGAEDGGIRWWALEHLDRPGGERRIPGPVTTLDLGFDGSALAAGSLAGQAALFDVRESNPKEFRPKPEGMGLAAITTGGHRGLLALAYHRGVIRLWPSAWEKPDLERLLEHPAAVTTMSVSRDGGILVAGDAAGWLHVWDAQSGRLKAPASPHDGEVVMVGYADDGSVVVSVSLHGEVQVWNTETGLRTTYRLRRGVGALGLSGGGEWLALAPQDAAEVQVWDVHARMARRQWVAESKDSPLPPVHPLPSPPPRALEGAQRVAWSRGGSHVAAVFSGGVVRVFDARSWKQVGQDMEHAPAVGAVELSEDGSLVFSSGRDRAVRVWDGATGHATGVVLAHDSFVPLLALSEAEDRLVTVTDPGEFRVWDVQTGESLTPAIGEGKGIQAVEITAEDRRITFLQQGSGWFETAMPPAVQGPLPEWFLVLMERLGQSTEIDRKALRELAHSTTAPQDGAQVAPAEETLAKQWADWLLAPPKERELFPGAGLTLSAYAERLRAAGGTEAQRELQRLNLE
ncbi:MAG: protein kinase [Verrucomicrobiales bacterium]|nr:protein kinase [Verrucomicrobiales bacterium]